MKQALYFFVIILFFGAFTAPRDILADQVIINENENTERVPHAFSECFLKLKNIRDIDFSYNLQGLLSKRGMRVGIGCMIFPPTTLFIVMCILRHFPHKKPMYCSDKTHHVSYGNQLGHSIIFINGFNDNSERLFYAVKKSLDQNANTNIYAPIFRDARTNRRFDVSWGQTYDCLQLIKFFQSIDFVHNDSITGIVCHSLGGARFLTLYDLLKNKDSDFLKKAELPHDEAKAIFKKLKKINKCPVAPLLDLQDTLSLHMRRWHIPFSRKLSGWICRYCMPFITRGNFDPHFQSPKQRLKAWSTEDFKNFHFFYPERDKTVGNIHVEWLCRKINVVKQTETTVITDKSVTILPSSKLDVDELQHESSYMLYLAANIAQQKNEKIE